MTAEWTHTGYAQQIVFGRLFHRQRDAKRRKAIGPAHKRLVGATQHVDKMRGLAPERADGLAVNGRPELRIGPGVTLGAHHAQSRLMSD